MTVQENEPELLVAPLRFACIEPGLYRGNYIRRHNLRFIKRLNLKTILSLTPEPLEAEIAEFAKSQDIQLIHLRTEMSSDKSKKKRGVPVSSEEVDRALNYMVNDDLQPMYIHCINGSQVTCLIVGCLRKLSFWSTASILDEFIRYSELASADQQFIEEYHANLVRPSRQVRWLWTGLSEEVVKNHPGLTFIEG